MKPLWQEALEAYDRACFRKEANLIYANWCDAYPAWIVALVEGQDVRFSDREWRGLRPSLCPLNLNASAEGSERIEAEIDG